MCVGFFGGSGGSFFPLNFPFLRMHYLDKEFFINSQLNDWWPTAWRIVLTISTFGEFLLVLGKRIGTENKNLEVKECVFRGTFEQQK